MKIYDIYKNYEGLGYAEPDMEDVERRAREAGAADGEVDGYNDGYESGKTDADFSKKYLTIEALSAGTFYVRKADIGYSVNGGAWETTTGVTELALNQGDTVRFRGTAGGNSLFTGNNLAFSVYGNIESLEYGDDFIGQTSIKKMSAFNSCFNSSTGLVDASNLVLPATTLNWSCYDSMFQGCTSLTKAPELPATTASNYCYDSMFQGCTSLTTAPELPATTLARDCYKEMFKACRGLTTAPELPATTLAYGCYESMFSSCSSLTTVPELPATALASNCYASMFQGCTSLTTAPVKLPATTLASDCYRNMFEGCTSLTTAPELPATTLSRICYSGMFSGCTSLNYIKCLATDISAINCLSNWVNGVASTGTFETPSTTDWKTGNDGIPEGWTRVDVE